MALKLRGLVLHHRIWLFWMVSVVGVAGPWGLKGCQSLQKQTDCIVSHVHDGDTLRVSCGSEKARIRLYCIDAPEMGQKPWGREARDRLRSLAPKGSEVRISGIDRDRYGRWVAEVFREEENLNLDMLRTGHAAEYDRYCGERKYRKAESQAREAGLGIWQKPGLQQRPWVYRDRKRRG